MIPFQELALSMWRRQPPSAVRPSEARRIFARAVCFMRVSALHAGIPARAVSDQDPDSDAESQPEPDISGDDSDSRPQTSAKRDAQGNLCFIHDVRTWDGAKPHPQVVLTFRSTAAELPVSGLCRQWCAPLIAARPCSCPRASRTEQELAPPSWSDRP